MTINSPVIDIDVFAIGCVHQLIATFDMTRALSQRFQDQELGYRQLNRLAAPAAHMTIWIQDQITSGNNGLRRLACNRAADFLAAQQGTNALDEQSLRERLLI